MIRHSKLVYCDETGIEHVLRLAGEGRAEQQSIVLSVWKERISSGDIVHARVENEHGHPVRLRWFAFELDTGFESTSPARFFKHGYQSWSPSYPAGIGQAAQQQSRSSLTEGTPENIVS